MKKILLILTLLVSFTSFSQVESDITNFINQPCNATICADFSLGACPGEVNSEGVPYTQTDYNVWYSTEDVILQYATFKLKNGRLELRNGANFVNNGIFIDVDTSCDTNNITDIVFIGGGQMFPDVATMNLTLSTRSVEEAISNKSLPDNMNFELYDIQGRVVLKGNTDSYTYQSIKESVDTNVYIFRFETDNGIVNVKDIL